MVEDKKLYRLYDGDTKEFIKEEYLTTEDAHYWATIGYDIEVVMQ